jgi:hypothetical protein
MRKALRLATATGLSVLLLFGVIINDDFRGSSRRWTFTEERHGDAAEEEMLIEDDSFAGRRRHLDSVCDKYDDIYRPEYYNLYRKVYETDISLNASVSYTVSFFYPFCKDKLSLFERQFFSGHTMENY